jgi:hypothetical protein
MNDPVANTGNNISKRTFSCASRHAELHIFLYSQKGIDSIKDCISKWKFTEKKSLWDRQYCTEGVFRVYRISIATLLLTQQRTLNQYWKEVLNHFFLPLLVVCRCKRMSDSIENYWIWNNIFLAIMSLGLETWGSGKMWIW